MTEVDLFRIAARIKFPGAVITGTGAFALVCHKYSGQAPDVFLFSTAAAAIAEQPNIGGQRVRIDPAPPSYRVPLRIGYGDRD